MATDTMTIVVHLPPELEAQLRDKAQQQGQNIEVVATQLLSSALAWETSDIQEAIAGIQQGLDDFEAGRFRSFREFADRQRREHDLPAN